MRLLLLDGTHCQRSVVRDRTESMKNLNSDIGEEKYSDVQRCDLLDWLAQGKH